MQYTVISANEVPTNRLLVPLHLNLKVKVIQVSMISMCACFFFGGGIPLVNRKLQTLIPCACPLAANAATCTVYAL